LGSHTYRHAGPACGVFSRIIEKPTEGFCSLYDLQLGIDCLGTRRALAHGLPACLASHLAQRFGKVKISDWLKEDDCSPNSREIFLQVGRR
jgi:hypothetical protein